MSNSPPIDLIKFLDATKRLTAIDLTVGHTPDVVLRGLMSEIGECCSAVDAHTGIKPKSVDESPRQEAIDVVITALALFFVNGGTEEELVAYGQRKLLKWCQKQRGRHAGYGVVYGIGVHGPGNNSFGMLAGPSESLAEMTDFVPDNIPGKVPVIIKFVDRIPNDPEPQSTVIFRWENNGWKSTATGVPNQA